MFGCMAEPSFNTYDVVPVGIIIQIVGMDPKTKRLKAPAVVTE